MNPFEEIFISLQSYEINGKTISYKEVATNEFKTNIAREAVDTYPPRDKIR